MIGTKFDLVVIGTGAAATTVALKCASAGWKVAIADSRPFGGTCALRGCDPKKVLVGAAEVMDWVRRMKGKGIQADQARIDWANLIRFKRSFTDPVPKNREADYAKAGIETFHDRAHFVSPTAVQVGTDVLEGRYIVVATGAAPRKLDIPGEEFLTTSEQFLELESLPGSIVFIGGGYISVEFAHVAFRVAKRVIILHRGQRLLEAFDPELVEQLRQRTRELGAEVHLRMEVRAVEKIGERLRVRASIDNEQRSFETDLVVHGAGRVPDIEHLDLPRAHVEAEKQGIKVNRYLQSTSNPFVYAAGDAAASGGPPLTPIAGYEGRIVATNLLEGNSTAVNYGLVPTVVFSIPPLAAVGFSEKAAREKGLRFRTHREITNSWYSSRRIGEECSGFKILIEEKSDRILGVHLLGPHADEIVNLFALAINSGIPASEIRRTIFGYPTLASDIQYML